MRIQSAVSATVAIMLLGACDRRSPGEVAEEVCPFIVATQADESLSRMEVLTSKGGLSPSQAAEANRDYEFIALSNVPEYIAVSENTPQSVCSVAVGAALGDEAHRKRIAQDRSAVAKATYEYEVRSIKTRLTRKRLSDL